jgi:EasF-like predicted methyltransferase
MTLKIATPRNCAEVADADGSRLLNGHTPSVVSATRFASATGNSNTVQVSVPPIVVQSAPSSTGIIDIRSSRGSLLDLDSKTLEGLRQPYGSKFLPSLLLWDEKGKDLYSEILACKHYYPYRVENELLKQRINDITSTIASSGTDLLVELGAGNMHKTTQFLTCLDNHLDVALVYYALDIDRAELESSLSLLKARTNLRHIELRGLLGTYEDGARWLSRPEAGIYRTTLIWLGNSIANFMPHEARKILGSFTGAPGNGFQNLAGFLLAVDGCQDESLIECAYDTPGGQSRRWVKYALEAARRRLGGPEAEKLLDDDSWRVEGRWVSHRQCYENYLTAARHLEGTVRGEPIHLRRGERVKILASGKWTNSNVSNICSQEGLDVVEWWSSPELDYSKWPTPWHLIRV